VTVSSVRWKSGSTGEVVSSQQPVFKNDRFDLVIFGGETDMATATKDSKTKIKLQPIGERIVVRREESEEVTKGGIVLPDSAQKKPARGVVVSVGTGKLLDDGTRSKPQVKEGDRVLFTSYAGENVEVGGDEFLLMREDDVLAIVD
jgi:chaperonin GroES